MSGQYRKQGVWYGEREEDTSQAWQRTTGNDNAFRYNSSWFTHQPRSFQGGQQSEVRQYHSEGTDSIAGSSRSGRGEGQDGQYDDRWHDRYPINNTARQYSTGGARWHKNAELDKRESSMSLEPEEQPYSPAPSFAPLTMKLPAIPDYWYTAGTLGGPQTYPGELPLPKPLPLVILDLNGTLLIRGARDANSSKRPNLRPYLSNFLEYCLSVRVEQEDHERRMQQWQEWDERQAQEGQQTGRSDLHGTHFWPAKAGPQPLPNARFRLLVWSSAQPHNVDSMIRAFLPPVQAEQLLRVYARDTLIIQRLYKHKSPSVKDLDVVWATLNQAEGSNKGDLMQAEARIFAEERSQQDSQESSDYRTMSARLWQHSMTMPGYDVFTGAFSDGQGYGPHNTLLLDDSLDKARLQPHNHVLLPEYDIAKARLVTEFRDAQEIGQITDVTEPREKDEHAEASLKDEAVPDNILLQAIGVLEHARKHVNISSWIRYGGLGNFGNMAHDHPGRTLVDQPWYVANRGIPFSLRLEQRHVEDVRDKWREYFSKTGDANAGMRYRTKIQDRTPAWWAEEGRRALDKAGIQPAVFM